MEQLSSKKHTETEFNLENLNLNNTKSAVVVIDHQGKMIRANTAWNEVLLKNHLLFSDDDCEDYFEIRRRFNQEDTFEAFQGINHVLNQELKTFSMRFYCYIAMGYFTMHVSPIVLADDSVGAVIYHTREKTDTTLISPPHFDYHTLIESCEDGVMIMELPTGKLIQANQSLCRSLGYPLEQLLHHSFWDITPHEWHQTDRNILDQQTTTCGFSSEFEKTFIKFDGSLCRVTVRYWLTLKNANEAQTAWVIVKDTQHKSTNQDSALEAQKLQSLGSIAHGMAHELNNILSIIMANTEMLDLYCAQNKQVAPHTHNILNATYRASNLLSGISAFHQLSGTEFAEIELFSTIANALKILKITLPPNISLQTSIEEDEMKLFGNASQIQQLLLTFAQFMASSLNKSSGCVEIRLKGEIQQGRKQAKLYILSPVAFISEEEIESINTSRLSSHHQAAIDYRLTTLGRVLQSHRCQIEGHKRESCQDGRFNVTVTFPRIKKAP